MKSNVGHLCSDSPLLQYDGRNSAPQVHGFIVLGQVTAATLLPDRTLVESQLLPFKYIAINTPTLARA